MHRGCHFRSILTASLLFSVLLPAVVYASQADMAASVIIQGEYIARAAGCISCHTDRKRHGKPFAGGRALRTPFGTFYPPNITPDTQTGIGSWNEQDFSRALRQGLNPQAEHLYPVFPYTAYTKLTDDDVHALWLYLRSITPVQQANQPHELRWFTPPRVMLVLWKMLYFSPGRMQIDPKKSTLWNRGAYLTEAMAHCSECHTPRNLLGGGDTDLRYAGARFLEEDVVAPNITPDRDTGIGKWSTGDLAGYLESGLTPDGDTAGSLMAEVIDDGLQHLRKEDLQAIAEYVKSLPPVAHSTRRTNKNSVPQKEEWE